MLDMPIIPIRAAVWRTPSRPLKIECLELEGPRADEVLVRLVARGTAGNPPGDPRQLIIRRHLEPGPGVNQEGCIGVVSGLNAFNSSRVNFRSRM